MTDVVIAEATGYGGGNLQVAGPLVQLAMAQAVDAAMALGVADDTPHEALVALVGADALEALLGEDAEAAVGSDFIRASKMTARNEALAAHRGLIKAHEGSMAGKLHAARDA